MRYVGALSWLVFVFWRSAASRVDEVNAMSSSMPSPKHLLDTPQFLQPIKNITVAIGREAVLSCSVMDLGHYKVGWMKADDQTILSLHTRVITHNPRITVSHDDNLNTWQLRIRQLKESDRGCYMCQINTGEMKKQLGCIDVQVPPDIDDTGTSGDVTINEGQNVTLSCTATGHPEPRILWRREDNTHLVVRDENLKDIVTVDSYRGAALNLIRVDRRQMAAYLCIASNDVPPSVSKRIILNVNFGPKVQAVKSSVGAPLGTTVKLKCDVEAFPSSNKLWKRDSKILVQGSKYAIQEKKSGVRSTVVLTISNVSRNDFGGYACTASSNLGKSEDFITLYEIIVTTTTTTTTTSTTTSTTTTTTEPNRIVVDVTSTVRGLPAQTVVLFGNNLDEKNHPQEDDPAENWLFPSVPPAPLELETYSGSPTHSVLRILVPTLVILCSAR